MINKLERTLIERKPRSRFIRLSAIREGIGTGILAGAGVALLTSFLPIEYQALFTALGSIGGGYSGYKSSIIRNNY
ncbi:MAG: hypothetical protein NTU63_02235 [Candidatus Pacearchaeota archaeon]|nr:hypothetical protein [Candidatus Pacearchaeota archaeon]